MSLKMKLELSKISLIMRVDVGMGFFGFLSNFVFVKKWFVKKWCKVYIENCRVWIRGGHSGRTARSPIGLARFQKFKEAGSFFQFDRVQLISGRPDSGCRKSGRAFIWLKDTMYMIQMTTTSEVFYLIYMYCINLKLANRGVLMNQANPCWLSQRRLITWNICVE